MDYELLDNKLTAKDFLRLREISGWSLMPKEQAEAGLKNSLFSVVAMAGGQVIGMGRLVGDGFTMCYIQDIIVLPEYQGKGIGSAIMERLLAYVSDNAMHGTSVLTGLFSAKGKEGFYQKFGFYIRPNETRGPGMLLEVKSK